MLYLLLISNLYIFAASDDHQMHAFYNDKDARALRRVLLWTKPRGPFRELDAYISYVSDIAYLGGDRFEDLSSQEIKQKLFATVYGDTFELKNSDFLANYLNAVESKQEHGIENIKSIIELGLKELACCTLKSQDIRRYSILTGMLQGLAASVAPDKQRLFWREWIQDAQTPEDKAEMFDLYRYVQKDLKNAHETLQHFNALIMKALEAQPLFVTADKKT